MAYKTNENIKTLLVFRKNNYQWQDGVTVVMGTLLEDLKDQVKGR